MRIGIDARELAGKPTGVGRYLSELLAQWQRLPEASRHQFVLYIPETPDRVHGAASTVTESPRYAWRQISGGSGTWWEQTTLPRAAHRDGVDLFFAPAYTAPISLRPPSVVTIHDLSFAAHPEWFAWREGLRRRWLTRRSARRAALVLTDSEFSRRQVIDLLGVPASRVRVVWLGVPSRQTDDSDMRAREPLILFAGSILNRRHVPDLIRAFASIAGRHPAVRLAIVGENRSYPFEDLGRVAADAGVASRVDIRKYVSDGELADLYGRARVFAFLSEYEGFGLTPLEALASGVPIVVVDTPVAREVYGDAALFVPTRDREAAAAAIESLLANEVARAQLLQRAGPLLARYSWERAARETLSALESVGLPSRG